MIVSPDEQSFFVRTSGGDWESYSMVFPDPRLGLSVRHCATFTSLTEAELHRICADIQSDNESWKPKVYLDSFDPKTMEAHVVYKTTELTTRHVYFELSEDGSRLSLARIRNETPTKSSTRTGDLPVGQP